MADGIYNAVSGAVAQSRAMDVVANNMANVSTSGFKADRITFAEVLAQTGPGQQSSSFVSVDKIELDTSQGALRPTGNALDLALAGSGFLALQGQSQEVYSRGGALSINSAGELVNDQGMAALGEGGQPVKLGSEGGKVTISSDGTVNRNGDTVGKLKLVEFSQPASLSRLGRGTFSAPAAAGAQAAKTTQVKQGFLESSNVNPVHGVTNMILASRAYEAFHQVISTFRRVDQQMVDKLGE